MEALYVPDIVDNRVTSFFDVEVPDGNLFIIMGSAGDGKTAIFGRAYRRSSQSWLKKEHLNLDATATTKFGETETDQLASFLGEVSDNLEVNGEPRRGLAINLGIALNFFAEPSTRGEYSEIWEAIDAARDPSNFDDGCLYHSDSGVTVANLSHRRLFNTHPQQFGAGLLREIVGKFDYTNAGEDNILSPFADIAQEIEDTAETNPIAYNFKWFADPEVQESIICILAAKAILSSQYLNPRRVLHFLSHILISPGLVEYIDNGALPTFDTLASDDVRITETLLWNSVYNVLTQANEETVRLDPCAVFDLSLDEEVLSLTNAKADTIPETSTSANSNQGATAKAKTMIRMRHLRRNSDVETEERTETFRQFTAARATLDKLWIPQRDATASESEIRDDAGRLTDEAYDLVVDAIKQWSQYTEAGDLVTIADGRDSTKYRFLSTWDRDKAELNKPKSQYKTTKETQLGKIWFEFSNGVAIPLPYELYRLLSLIADGYNPDAVDPKESEGVRLIHSQLSHFTVKDKELEVHNASGQKALQIQHKTGWEEGIYVEK